MATQSLPLTDKMLLEVILRAVNGMRGLLDVIERAVKERFGRV